LKPEAITGRARLAMTLSVGEFVSVEAQRGIREKNSVVSFKERGAIGERGSSFRLLHCRRWDLDRH